MQSFGFRNYAELLEMGAVETCPACPDPATNLTEDWVEHKYRLVAVTQDEYIN
jgi:hypothetical protein